MTATLTDRYVYAVGRRVPIHQRDELEQEVRALVADAADAQREQGSTDPERDALVQLGDPDRLAATYTDRRLQLIGPALFLDYRRTLVMLYSIVFPIIVVAVLFGRLLARDAIGDAIWGTVGFAFETAVHIGFWTTLIFAILERTTGHEHGVSVWKPEMLPNPDARTNAVGIGGLVGALVWSGLAIGAAFWQQFASPVSNSAGQPIPVLDPHLWTFWLPLFIVVLVLQVVLTAVVYARSRWTYALAAVRIVLDLALLLPIALLAIGGQLLNPAFFQAVGWPEGADAGNWLGALIAAIALLGIVFEAIAALRDASKSRVATSAAAPTTR